MQTPTTAQIRTAIEVLGKLGEHINSRAADSAVQLSESQRGIHQAGSIKLGAIEQTTRIEAVTAQLKQWRDELGRERRQCVSHHV